ncbi:hypothetical protein KOI35_07380 [Actinoplanes bogorensis]|uniref:Uncharacterized protein n=1 Tax=Paractinoplanes bogorensis TaxID=1610840 RepID=A0ABS5YIM1_9ACTN|nr:hypothetical protein [Actinoplanes bogorensis]MBU2663329.1 hypothetical protein [Actinoplanes bogorensis]
MKTYRTLLRLYPADHPRDEMLDVLLTAGRPMRRELPALVLGGLRARLSDQDPSRVRWQAALRTAALMLLIAGAVAPLNDLYYGTQLRSNLTIATWIVAGLASVAVMIGYRLPALGLAVAALLLSGTDQISIPATSAFAVAAVFLLVPGPRRPVLHPLAILLPLAWAGDYHLPAGVQLALVVALALWTVVDERLLLATGLALSAGLIVATVEVAEIDDTRGLLILAAWRIGLPAALVAVAALLLRRRATV